MGKCEFSFDEKCLELARHFYPNAPELDLWGLAQRLQDVVEAEDIEQPTPETGTARLMSQPDAAGYVTFKTRKARCPHGVSELNHCNTCD